MDDETKNEPGCLSKIIGFIFIVAVIVFIYRACDSDTQTSITPSTPTPAPTTYAVNISVLYEKRLLSSNPICDIYIDDTKVAEAQAADSTKTISIELVEGKHSIRIKTEDWGLTSGAQSNKVEFTVSDASGYRFAYKKTLTKIELSNENTSVVVN